MPFRFLGVSLESLYFEEKLIILMMGVSLVLLVSLEVFIFDFKGLWDWNILFSYYSSSSSSISDSTLVSIFSLELAFLWYHTSYNLYYFLYFFFPNISSNLCWFYFSISFSLTNSVYYSIYYSELVNGIVYNPVYYSNSVYYSKFYENFI